MSQPSPHCLQSLIFTPGDSQDVNVDSWLLVIMIFAVRRIRPGSQGLGLTPLQMAEKRIANGLETESKIPHWRHWRHLTGLVWMLLWSSGCCHYDQLSLLGVMCYSWSGEAHLSWHPPLLPGHQEKVGYSQPDHNAAVSDTLRYLE